MAKGLMALIEPYSPWVTGLPRAAWQDLVPTFRRPVFGQLLQDLHGTKQIISITGPRRVGKSTLLQQLIIHLLEKDKVDPSRVWYFSMDDPAMFRPGAIPGHELIEDMVTSLAGSSKEKNFLFLDEIQRADRWELSLKKCYDLKYPVRTVISGSASSPIFKKSRESHLGRVTDYHVLPFSFREFLLYRLDKDPLTQEMKEVRKLGGRILALLTRGRHGKRGGSVTMPAIPKLSKELHQRAERELEQYLVDGGFPEVWKMACQAKKIEFLFVNQVKKVIYEDLTLATEFRKPEELKKFYISLLEKPGAEVNLEKLAREVGINVQQVKKYLPLLEMTDLVRHVEKFRGSAIRLRHGNRKYYLIDMALRNAVLRIRKELLKDESILGLYAENLVFNALKKTKGILQIDYYREGGREVDFVSHVRPNRYWPVEVRYRKTVSDKDLGGIREFCKKYACQASVVVTKNEYRNDPGLFHMPLVLFLLLFD